MKPTRRLLLSALPALAILSACGGGDTEDRLDVADPKVRFVHASPLAPNVSLYREAVLQADATNVPYRFASNYFDVSTVSANWSVQTATGNVTIGTVAVPATRGNRYTIVAVPGSSTETGVYLITDPYNKSLTSNNARLRLMNAAFNTSSVDVYLNAPGTDIAAVGPRIAATAYRTSGPATGNDSIDLPAGTYQLAITNAGTKTVLFRGTFAIADNQDLLLITVPDLTLTGGIRTLLKVEGTAGTGEIAPS
jgi:Domain of unknown function (DUF4397)